MKPMTYHVADKPDQKAAAHNLVASRYCDLGYDISQLVAGKREIVMLANQCDALVATLTLRHERHGALACETAFAAEVAALRGRREQAGKPLVEVGRFASAQRLAPTELAGFFLLSARALADARQGIDLLIEVNPKHQRFYERGLGFAAVSPTRLCPRVNAPAVLMHLPVAELPRNVPTRLRRIPRERNGVSQSTPITH